MDKMVLMAGGHEIWLEAPETIGKNVEITLAYGHNMRGDGTPDPERLIPGVYIADGKKVNTVLKSKNEQFTLCFTGEQPGYYMPVVDMAPVILTHTAEKNYQRGPKNKYKDAIYAGAFHQMAKTIVKVGEPENYKPEHLHGILDILPGEASLTVGKTINLTVLFEGKPLPDIDIKAVSKKEGTDMALVKTDENGVAVIPVMVDGTWMFLVRHRDPSRTIPDEYDEAVFVTTLVMETA